MKTNILITLCLALSFCVEVYAEDEHEVKRGRFPFMAFIYYPDETVVDSTGARFLRGAVLIRPEWLVTSAVGPSVLVDSPTGFPQKTLLARLGAVAIDAKFTLNEDEDEQEREIIQIVRPYNHSATQWWHTDISLMKTLLPFNVSTAVDVATPSFKPEIDEKTCTILVYTTKGSNLTEGRNLMLLTVELLPSSAENCGRHFLGNTMACARDTDESKNDVINPNFCQGNRGGPLICESNVIGLQTYIDNDCKQPHLYQLLTAWKKFITCGTEDKCQEEHCSNICSVANKDPESDVTETKTSTEEDPTVASDDAEVTTRSWKSNDEIAIDTSSSTTTTATSEDETTIELTSEHQTTSTERPSTIHHTTKEYSTSTKEETVETTSWPNEKYPDARKSIDEEFENLRQANLEAQQQTIQKVKKRSAGQSHALNYSVIFVYLILALLS